MSLRDELRSLPRGKKVAVYRSAHVSKQTFYAVLREAKCGKEAARKIATAAGCPERWAELVVFHTPSDHETAA